MKLISICVLALQILLFLVLTIVVLWGYNQVVLAGAGFDPRFASNQLWRLIAFLAPYLMLPVTIVFSMVFYKKAKYDTAVWLPLVLMVATVVSGQIYLSVVPDPIKENFGNRPSPYEGFLVLPSEAVPSGFKETKHHYTKREYTVSYTKMVNGKQVNLDIAEGDRIMFGTDGSKLVQEFEYQGITGQVYIHQYKGTQDISYNLIWLNPPKQRIAIYLSQTPSKEYSPQDLINILKSMRAVEQTED